MKTTNNDTLPISLMQLDNADINVTLKITDLENIFGVYQDKRKNLVYDINETLYINVDKSILSMFICDCDMHWTLISYKLYGTTRLAWLLWKINDVQPQNIFDIKHPGDVILYLPKDCVNDIISNINEFDGV